MNIIKLAVLTLWVLIWHIQQEAHLLLVESDQPFPYSKKMDEDGTIHFFVKAQHFESKSGELVKMEKHDLSDVNFMNIEELLQIEDSIRKKHIDSGSKEGVIYIIPKNAIFQKIYIYEKVDSVYLRYRVEWIEEEIDLP
jgi:hypothetical protein